MGTFYRVFRALAREQVRQEKQRLNQYKVLTKQQELANAIEAVQQYDAYIDTIKSIHKYCDATIDWKSLLITKAPEMPINQQVNYKKTEQKIGQLIQERDNYKPSIFTKLLGREEIVKAKLDNKIKQLQDSLPLEIEKDEIDYRSDLTMYHQQLSQWQREIKTVNGILEGNKEAYKTVIADVNPFEKNFILSCNKKTTPIVARLFCNKLFFSGLCFVGESSAGH